MNDLAIRLSGVTKRYTIHHDKPTLVEKLINGKNEAFYALKDITLEIKKGERVGIIGPNGSGKTTILKLIAGITAPTSGKVKTYGRVVSLIDLEAGFHPEFTGEQNVFLNGMLLGMRKDEISKKLRRIIKFSGVGKFIDAPMFTYSEGMKLRLGFSVVAHTNPDIILLDENMAVGDQDFRQKSFAKIREFFESGKTVVMVSHYMELIQRICKTVYWLEKGKIKDFGNARQVVSRYKKSFKV